MGLAVLVPNPDIKSDSLSLGSVWVYPGFGIADFKTHIPLGIFFLKFSNRAWMQWEKKKTNTYIVISLRKVVVVLECELQLESNHTTISNEKNTS